MYSKNSTSPYTVSSASNVSMLVELPESLYSAVKSFLENNPGWDQDALVTMAIAQFLRGRGNNA